MTEFLNIRSGVSTIFSCSAEKLHADVSLKSCNSCELPPIPAFLCSSIPFLPFSYKYEWKLEEARKNLLRTHTTAVSARMLYRLAQQVNTRGVFFCSLKNTCIANCCYKIFMGLKLVEFDKHKTGYLNQMKMPSYDNCFYYRRSSHQPNTSPLIVSSGMRPWMLHIWQSSTRLRVWWLIMV